MNFEKEYYQCIRYPHKTTCHKIEGKFWWSGDYYELPGATLLSVPKHLPDFLKKINILWKYNSKVVFEP